MRFNSSHASLRRSGVVLLVVMAMLALFASVALSFVFYADSEANASSMNAQSIVQQQADIDPEVLAAYFLSQMLYDTTNVYSALRGWSLGRSIYGYNDQVLNFTPYNSSDRFTMLSQQAPQPNISGQKVNYFNLINYQEFKASVPVTAHGLNTTDALLNKPRKPEYIGGTYVGGANPPWTTYDTNSLFLAQVDSSGTVYMPSFHRPWIMKNTQPDPAIAPNKDAAKYMSLRPDLVWNKDPNNASNNQTVTVPGVNGNVNVTTSFITPDSDTPLGPDVRNLDNGRGMANPNAPGINFNNDSYWTDAGFPVMTAPNGKRYKPLIAPLVMDLSNRLHLLAHGNAIGTLANNHVSNQGFGPTEVNLGVLGPNYPITNAQEAGGNVTVTTGLAHGFKVGQWVQINDIPAPKNGYNGIFQVTAVPGLTQFRYKNTITGLPPSGFVGIVRLLAPSELAALYNLRYNGPIGGTVNRPAGNAPNFRPGTYGSYIDADALDPNTKLSTTAPIVSLQTTLTLAAAVPAGGTGLVTVNPTSGTSGGLPWAFFGVFGVGSKITLGANVLTITAVPPTTASGKFKATFSAAHAAGPMLFNANMYEGYPVYPFGWLNGTAGELTKHPLALNLLNPLSPPSPMSNQEALLRWGGTNSPALTSHIFQLMPTTFGINNPNARNMVTLANWHLDRIAASPFIPFDRTAGVSHYTYKPNSHFPSATIPLTSPNYANLSGVQHSSPTTTPPYWSGEFDQNWNSTLGKFLRVDLNRPLTDYPAPVNGLIPNGSVYNNAVADRQQFATDIYQALIRVTGAHDPNVVAGMIPTNTDYQAARWLAQLAVNIVDFIDNDDYMTQFAWYKSNNVVIETVYGTELPRLVLNEVYTQHDTGNNNANSNRIDVWAELFNPYNKVSTGSAYPLDAGSAILENNNTPVYQIEIHPSSAALTARLHDPANNTGDSVGVAGATPPQSNWGGLAWTKQVLPAQGSLSNPVTTKNIAPANGATEVAATVTIKTVGAHNFVIGQAVTVSDVPVAGYNGSYLISATPSLTSFQYVVPTKGLAPSGGGFVQSGSNNGYYVIGPLGANPNPKPNLPVTHLSASMSIIPPNNTTGISLLLRRLANPHRPANAANPYVTVDYLDGIPVASVAGAGPLRSYGRKQPYGASPSKLVPSTSPSPLPQITQPANTFFRLNDNSDAPFPWLVHLDRPPVNPIELLNVSGFRPHELTQQFANPIAATISSISSVASKGPPPFLTVTVTTNSPHGLAVGNSVYVLGVSLSGYNTPINSGPVSVKSVPTPNSFTYKILNTTTALAASSGGSVTIAGDILYQHYAPWNVFAPSPLNSTPAVTLQNIQNALIYRALDQMSSHYMAGMTTGGKFPGNINLNTIMDPEVFQALCDAPDDTTLSSSSYSWFQRQNDVNRIFRNLLASRGVSNNAAPPKEPTPFKSFSAATNVGGVVSFDDTWFRKDPTDPAGIKRLFAVGNPAGINANHPYVQSSLLQKIYNNISTTSNVFAIWWTVGFFEVLDETVSPPRLGQEIGRAENRHIRHRFFAIVDRSGMQIHNTTSIAAVNPAASTPQLMTMQFHDNVNAANPAQSVQTMTGPITTYSNTKNYVIGDAVNTGGTAAYICIQSNVNKPPATNPTFWQPLIQPGMLLEITDPAAPFNTEVVAVESVLNNTFKAIFTRSHPAGSLIRCRGNPGPQANYNPRADSNVVLHFSVIK